MDNQIFDLDHLQKTYFKMATPVVLGMVVSLVYNLTDTYFISLLKNTDLIAGISICAPVFMVLMAFGNIFGQGGSSLISRLLGQNDHESVRQVSSFSFYISLIIGAILGILMLVFKTPLLLALGCDDKIITYASEYFSVMAIGAPFAVCSFIHQNLLRCEGKAKEAMYATMAGTITNMILDPIFILGLKMGAMGAAIATVIGYVVNVGFALCVVLKKNSLLSVKLSDLKISGEFLSSILGVGVTAAITNIASSLCMILLNKRLIVYGTDNVAIMGVVGKVGMIAQMAIIGFAFGGVPLFGFLYGAKNKEKLNELIKFVVTFLCSLSLVLSIILIVLGKPLMGIFFDDPSLIANGSFMLMTQCIGTVFMAVVLVTTVLFQATGKVLPALVMSLSRQGFVFVIVLMVASSLFGLNGILFTQFVADIFSAIIGLVLYYFTLVKSFK